MRTRYLNRLLIVATLLVSTAPLYAQRQRLNVTKLKEEAQKVITSISSDTAQMRAYCEATDLGEQIAEAAREQDEKKVDTLMQRMDELEKTLGPAYPALFNDLYDADPNSKDVQDILQMFAMLDQACPPD